MPGNHVLLETISLTQSAASVTFDNIPQTGYTDLKIVLSARDSSTGNASGNYYTIAFNGGSSYAARYLQGNGSSANSGTEPQLAGISDAASGTANTFSNDEVYIPNYTSTTNKSYSVDAVNENNTTGAYATLVAGSATSSTAINSITFTPNSSASFLQYSTFSLYGVAAFGTTPLVAPKATGGNIVANDGTYWYHAFLSSGNFVPQTPLTCDVLTIAGGGGGSAGGGGAGGLLYSTSNSLSATNYAVLLGAGGAGMGSDLNGFQGSNSQFGSLTAAVGGGFGAGGAVGATTGGSGGSGGGAGAAQGSTTITASGGTGSQGSNGGGVSNTSRAGGGGGGFSAAGSAAPSGNGVGGTGGNGTNAYSSFATVTSTGVSGYYAGGGGGTGTGTSTKAGGAGGGGTGGGDTVEATVGTINTGSGGGGSRTVGGGKAGGSGIVIIRYAMV